MKILGYKISEGTYQGTDYKNIILYVELKNNYTKGLCTEMIKVKYSNFINILNESKIGIETIIGLDVNFYFDKFGNVIHISKV